MGLKSESEPMENFCAEPELGSESGSANGNKPLQVEGQPTKISGYGFVHKINSQHCPGSVNIIYLLDSMKSSSSSDTGRSSSQIKLAAQSMLSSLSSQS